MSLTARNIREKIAGSRAVRKIGWWVAGLFVLVTVAGFLVAPPLVKYKLEESLSAQLQRKTTVEHVRINPFELSITLQGFVVRERGSDEPVLSVEELYVNASGTSFYRLAPVINVTRMVKPHLRVVRNADGSYNFRDVIDEFLASPAGPTPQFSLNNIEVIDGRIDFDDRPEKQRHQVTAIRIGVPFLSSLPYETNITVQPFLSATIDGAPFRITGETRPFADTRETTLNLNLDALQLQRFLDYSPVPLNFRLASGQLDTRIKLAFAMLKNKPDKLTVSGSLNLSRIDLRDADGGPLLMLPALALDIESLDILRQKASVKRVRIDGMQAHVTRLKDSSFNVMAFLKAAAKSAPPPDKANKGAAPAANSPASAPKPFEYKVGEIRLTGGTLHLKDEVPARPVRMVLQNVEFGMQGLSNARDAKAAGRLAFKADTLNAFSWSGDLQLEPLRVDGKLDMTGLRLAALGPYYEGLLDIEIVQGTLDVATSFSASRDADKLEAQVSNLGAAIRSLQTKLPGDKDLLARVSMLEIKGAAADFAKRSVAVSEITGREVSARVVRDGDGRINLTRVFKPAQAAAAGGGSDAAPWDFRVKRIAFERAAIDFRDLTRKTHDTLSVSELAVTGENFSNAKNTRSQVSVRATVNNTGKLALSGPLTIDPFSLAMSVEATALDLLPLQPLVEDKLNIAITGGALSAKGALTLDVPAGAPVRATYKGAAEVSDFVSIDNLTREDFLKWKSLQVAGIEATVDPALATVADITLAGFYSRLVVNPDGTINLQNILKKPGEPQTQGTSPPVAAGGKPAEAGRAPAQSTAAPPAPADQGPAGESAPLLSIGKIALQNGIVSFSDNFIKPNYAANLSEITGSVGRMTRDTPGEVELRGFVQKTAPITIAGRVNALAKDLFVDIKASARDVELPPLTAYAVKYAGYGIEKGKLSMDVKYHLENRKLTAENHLSLDQLTFGRKVDSATATKLPVLLGVALLKDSRGVIDIDLPISGSLDDPQFSLGGVIGRVFGNLLLKIVTSPFALIGSLFGGGGGAELAYLEFAPGRAVIAPAAAKKLGTVAKALNERPALKIEITGRVDAEGDREGLRRLALERKIKAQKLKATLKSGEAEPPPDDITVESGEYEKYLTAAYREEKFEKPRNVIGLARSLPVAEMERLMLEHAEVTDEDLQRLADQRAQEVKDSLVRSGKIDVARVFLVASKLSAEGIKDKGKPSRVDFALR